MNDNEFENRMQTIKKLSNATRDSSIIEQTNYALKAITIPEQLKIVTSSIKKIRKLNYRDLALELASLAYDLDNSNQYFLGEQCIILRYKGQNDVIINRIDEFLERENGKLQPKDKEYLTVTLAHAYRGVGDVLRGIQRLEDLHSNAPNVLEALAELYHVNGEFHKTINLLKDKDRRSGGTKRDVVK